MLTMLPANQEEKEKLTVVPEALPEDPQEALPEDPLEVRPDDLFAARLLELEAKLDRIERHCQNMTDHIGFVDRVYRTLQAPFQMLLNFASFRQSRLPLETSLKSEHVWHA